MREDAYYGKVYRERKAYELARDESAAMPTLLRPSSPKKRITDAGLKKTLESGHLSAGQLDLRARRYAVKLFPPTGTLWRMRLSMVSRPRCPIR